MTVNKIRIFKKLFGEFRRMSFEYGLSAASSNLIWWLNFYIPSPIRFRMSKWALHYKTKWLKQFIETQYPDIISRYSNDSTNNNIQPISHPNIWIFWSHGEENMPELVKSCYSQLCKLHNNVTLLTCNNIYSYINLPSIIFKKANNGELSWAHVSDIIRTTLLSKYGGLWLDATVWVANEIDFPRLMNYPIYSANGPQSHSSSGICFWTSLDMNWSTWCLWSNHQNPALFGFVSEIMIQTACHCKIWPDYVYQDFLIYYALKHFPNIRSQIGLIQKYPCKQRNTLASIMNKTFNSGQYDSLCATDNFFKLSYRANWNSVTPDGKQTFYGKLISNECN